VTTLDTLASLLAGFTIFGILGYSAKMKGVDIKDVTSSGGGLAFISYPEAISKFEDLPQV
jgi:solute carrier family 6 (neurotransmitter transporter, glycine) member 5/9